MRYLRLLLAVIFLNANAIANADDSADCGEANLAQDWARVIESCSKAIDRNPDTSGNEHELRGRAYEQTGRKDEALKDYLQAIRMGDSLFAGDSAKDIYMKNGKYRELLELYDLVEENNRNLLGLDLTTHLSLDRCATWRKLGDLQKALEHCSQQLSRAKEVNVYDKEGYPILTASITCLKPEAFERDKRRFLAEDLNYHQLELCADAFAARSQIYLDLAMPDSALSDANAGLHLISYCIDGHLKKIAPASRERLFGTYANLLYRKGRALVALGRSSEGQSLIGDALSLSTIPGATTAWRSSFNPDFPWN